MAHPVRPARRPPASTAPAALDTHRVDVTEEVARWQQARDALSGDIWGAGVVFSLLEDRPRRRR